MEIAATIIRSLKGTLTMVVYPEPPKGQHLTPSPFVDAFQSAIHESGGVKAQQNVVSLNREESAKHNVKPGAFFVAFKSITIRLIYSQLTMLPFFVDSRQWGKNWARRG
jgi:hypothetical protein